MARRKDPLWFHATSDQSRRLRDLIRGGWTGGSFAFMLRRLASEMSRKRCSGEKREEREERTLIPALKSAAVADARGARCLNQV